MSRWQGVGGQGLSRGAVVATLVLAVGCSRHAPAPDIVQAGQVDVQLPPGWTVTAHGATRPSTGGGAAAGGGGAAAGGGGAAAGGGGAAAGGSAGAGGSASKDTIPLAKQDPTTAFFQATGAFSACLRANGTSFIGAPDTKNPSSPTNDPNYIKSLSTCAASSHILQALKDYQAAQAKLTPAQIQQQNQGFLNWRQCMIGKGWTIPTPKPDAQGRLFNIGSGGSGFQITPPPGQDIATSPDVRDCASQVQAASSGTSSGG